VQQELRLHLSGLLGLFSTPSHLPGLLGFLPTFFHKFVIAVEKGGNDWNHVGLDNASPNILCPTHADVDDTLESEIPLPHSHRVMTAALF
jgi:hypothetical protein